MAPESSSDASSPLSSVPSSASRSSTPMSELSWRSSSPTPPPELQTLMRSSSSLYPSPPASQQTSQSSSPTPDGMHSSIATDKEGPPPAKRRKMSKERTTEYLDLSVDSVDREDQPQLTRLLNVLHKRQKIVVIAGAGISVSAGIPDFRSSQGLFRSLKGEYNLKGSGKDLFDASVYKDDVSTSSFHDMVNTMSRLTKEAKPTAFHHMLATIAQENRLLRLYSQNVDGIDTSLQPLKTCVPLCKERDGKWPRTVQLHGGLDKMVCSKCHELSDLDSQLFDGPVPPLCPRCEEINDIRTNHEGKRSHGIGRLRPRMVLYNEHNPDDEAIGAVTKEDLRKRPDAVIVVGTTLKVPGVRRIVREMCATVRDRRGGVTVWINNDPPPVAKDLEDCWDIVVQGPSDEVARHAAMRKWDDPVISEEFSEVSEEDARKVAANGLSVELPSRSNIKQLEVIPLPSHQHNNNSYRPPSADETPRKPVERSPDWSPISTPGERVFPSIEDTVDDESVFAAANADVFISSVPTGLLTPSKSQRNSPARRDLPKKQSKSVFDKLIKDTSKQPAAKSGKQPPAAKGAAKPTIQKKKTVKYIKPSASQKAAQAKAQAQSRQKGLIHTFKLDKISSLAGKGNKNETSTLANGASKLRKVSNASSVEPHLQSLSPQDPRNNASPALPSIDKDKEDRLSSFAGIEASENLSLRRKQSRMDVESIMN